MMRRDPYKELGVGPNETMLPKRMVTANGCVVSALSHYNRYHYTVLKEAGRYLYVAKLPTRWRVFKIDEDYVSIYDRRGRCRAVIDTRDGGFLYPHSQAW